MSLFAHRRKRMELNKITYYDNLVNYQLTPHQGVIPILNEVDIWVLTNGIDAYNKAGGNVGIGMTEPITKLDVSGSINASSQIMVNYVPIASPVGSITAYTMSIDPSGWLICDGRTVSREKYAALFSVIGTTFGVGNGTTTFGIPNYQGAFLRGAGTDPTNTYAGPSVNTSQAHATQTHRHSASSSITDPGHSHTQYTFNDDYNNSNTNGQSEPAWPAPDAFSTPPNTKTWSNINSATTGVTVSTTIGDSTTSVNANETRPYNYGVYWIIKF